MHGRCAVSALHDRLTNFQRVPRTAWSCPATIYQFEHQCSAIVSTNSWAQEAMLDAHLPNTLPSFLTKNLAKFQGIGLVSPLAACSTGLKQAIATLHWDALFA